MQEVAKVKCVAKDSDARKKYIYDGIEDCIAANLLGGGDRLCVYGCIGLGTCVRVCEEDAISINDGLAIIDSEKCTACGKCVDICPKNVIEWVSGEEANLDFCNSKNKIELIRQICEVGGGIKNKEERINNKG